MTFQGGIHNGKDTVEVAQANVARYGNFISMSGGNNRINNSNILHSTILAGDGNNRVSISTANGGNTIEAGKGIYPRQRQYRRQNFFYGGLT